MASLCINETWDNTTKFEERGVDGKKALKLTDDDLKSEMGIEDSKERRKYLNVIRNKNQHKVINDPVHGTIKLHPLLIRIIDTPQFQRLRNMKQLGGASFVYPGACHTRFEHSIGVAHLAGEFARALKPSVTTVDVLCVQIAGLCHDLGHGPFSHLFEEVFGSAKHEEISIKMFDHLVKENGLKPLMKLYGLKDEDLDVIKEMMNPKGTGRTNDKNFLYEIVSNSTNGVDVDKFDYFARDCHYLGLQNNFDHRRYLEFARVCEVNGEKTHICVRDKEVDNVYDIFQTRYRLHKRAYQHKVTKAVELMIKDALRAAKDLPIEGTDKKLCEASEDMAAYSKLTDHLFQQILYSTDSNLEKAKEILERIMSRDLYECLLEREVTASRSAPVNEKEKLKEKVEELKQALTESLKGEGRKTPEDLEVMVGKYGWKEEDPIKDTYFYSKKDPTKAFKKTQNFKTHPAHLPQSFIRVFIKNKRGGERITMNKDSVKRLKDWCKENGFGLQDDDKPGEPRV